MKKFTLSIALLLVSITSTVFAQGVGLGLKAGVNFANQSLANFPNNDTKSITGFLAGVYVPIYFS
ncbi:MAG: hypothetical protein U5K79_18550 [Cyclobacteriaceae bacterium]|nr:hypothetical protein [Cyclobacteriaceae bacterium]